MSTCPQPALPNVNKSPLDRTTAVWNVPHAMVLTLSLLPTHTRARVQVSVRARARARVCVSACERACAQMRVRVLDIGGRTDGQDRY